MHCGLGFIYQGFKIFSPFFYPSLLLMEVSKGIIRVHCIRGLGQLWCPQVDRIFSEDLMALHQNPKSYGACMGCEYNVLTERPTMRISEIIFFGFCGSLQLNKMFALGEVQQMHYFLGMFLSTRLCGRGNRGVLCFPVCTTMMTMCNERSSCHGK